MENVTDVSRILANETMTTPTRMLSGVQALRDPFEALVAVVHFLLCILNMTGNALTMVSVWSTKSLRTTQNKYIVALALVDFVVGFTFTEMLLQYYIKDYQTANDCQFYVAILYSCFIYSLIIMLSVAIDRYLYIARPFFYIKHVTGTKTRLVLILEGATAFTFGCSASFVDAVEKCNPFFILNNKMMRYVLPEIFLTVGVVIGLTYGRIASMAKMFRDKKIKRLLVINETLAKNKSLPKRNEMGTVKHSKASDNENIVTEQSVSSYILKYPVETKNKRRVLEGRRKMSVTGADVRHRNSSENEKRRSGGVRRDMNGLGLTNHLNTEATNQLDVVRCECGGQHEGPVVTSGIHTHQTTESNSFKNYCPELHKKLTDQSQGDLQDVLQEDRICVVDSGTELCCRRDVHGDHRSVRPDNLMEVFEFPETDPRKEYINSHHCSDLSEHKIEFFYHQQVLTNQKAGYQNKSAVLQEQCPNSKTAPFKPESLSFDQSTSLEPGPNPWSLSSLRWMKQMVVVFGLFVISWMPIMVYIHLTFKVTLDFRLAYILSLLSIASSGVNFFVYSYFNQHFRVVLKRRLRCHCRD